MIKAHELATRLSAATGTPMSSDDIVGLAAAAGFTIHPSTDLDITQVETLLRAAPRLQHLSAADLVADQPAYEPQRGAIPPVTFSSPGSVDNPEPPAAPARRRPGGTSQHRGNDRNQRRR